MDDSVETVIYILQQFGCICDPCGSRVTCAPAPTNTDEDWLIEVPANDKIVSAVVNELLHHGFHWEGGEHYQIACSSFMSWRRERTNFIVTSTKVFADRHRTATFVCKRLNLLKKPDRIALFQAVLYGVRWDECGDEPMAPSLLKGLDEVIF